MYEDIKEQFKSVISFSQSIPEPKVDFLFKEWEQKKAKFIKRFGGLIYEWPEQIEFTLDPKEKRVRAMEFANSVSDTYNNPTLAEFIDENIDTFFDNKVSKSLGKQIPEGMKLIKAFKFFESDKSALRSIQDCASQLIQENKIKGTLCFSVHPLDFLSSSENTYSWRSCHALDGEYRAGNLSYMVDDSTFMVYLKGADNTVIPGFGGVQWNSKKWRMLIHAASNDDIMFAGRQYPFSSKSGIDTVLNIYNNLLAMEGKSSEYPWVTVNKYGGWRADYVDSYVPYDAETNENCIELEGKYLVYAYQLVELNQVVKEGINALNYNDVLKSSCYSYPYYTILNPYCHNSVQNLISNPIIVGGEVPCLHCHNEVITNSETMRCDDCELAYGTECNDTYASCDCCGTRIYLDDSIYVEGAGEYICEHCYDSQCFICDYCSNVFYNTEKVFVPGSHADDDGTWVCKDCYEDYLESKERYHG